MRRLLAGMACSLALVLGAAALDGSDDARSPERSTTPDTQAPDPTSPPATPAVTAPPVTVPVPVTEPVSSFRQVVDDYISALAEARWTDAYAHLCPRATAVTTPEAFAEELAEYRRRQPLLEGHIDQQGPATETNVVVHVEMSLGTIGSQVFIELTRDDPSGPWQICSVNGGVGEGAIWPEVLDPDERRP